MSYPINRPSFSDVSYGDTVILGDGERQVVAKVTGSQPFGFTGATLSDGTTLEFVGKHSEDRHFRGGDGRRWHPYFTNPLPEGTDAMRVEYARVLRGERTGAPGWRPAREWDDSLAFLVTEAGPAGVKGRMVSRLASWKSEADDSHHYKSLKASEIEAGTARTGDFWLSVDAVALDRACLPESLAVGDIVVGTGVSVAISEGLAVATIRSAARLPITATPYTLSAAFPQRAEADLGDRIVFPPVRNLHLAPVAKLLFETESAHRRADPDMALVIGIPDLAAPDRDTERTGVVAHTGETFYREEATGYAHEAISGAGIQPGLRVVTKPRYWSHTSHEGERDSGFEFDDRPAVEADLALFGFDMESLGRELRGYFEQDEQDDADFLSMTDLELAQAFLLGSYPQPRVLPAEIRVPN